MTAITAILFIIIGIIVAIIFFFVIYPNIIQKHGPVVKAPLWRRRPLLLDKDFGVAEIQTRAYAGEGRVRLGLSNGELRTYETKDIIPISPEDCLAGTERAIYVAKPSNLRDTGRTITTNTQQISEQSDINRLRNARDEDVLRILRRAKDIGEIAKPTKPGDQQQR